MIMKMSFDAVSVVCWWREKEEEKRALERRRGMGSEEKLKNIMVRSYHVRERERHALPFLPIS